MTKELPLTKAAAELLRSENLKEGMIITPYRIVCNYSQIEVIKTDIARVNMKGFITKESSLDFLRAMHFNTEFKEGDFVPKI